MTIGTVIVKLTDGLVVEINDVQDYFAPVDNGDFITVKKNGMCVYFNKNSVVYIGRKFELNNQKKE